MARTSNEWDILTRNSFTALLDNENSSVNDRFSDRSIRRYKRGDRAPSTADQLALFSEVTDFGSLSKTRIRRIIRSYLDVTHTDISDFAAEMGVSTNTVERWISGKTVPRRSNLRRMQEIFSEI